MPRVKLPGKKRNTLKSKATSKSTPRPRQSLVRPSKYESFFLTASTRNGSETQLKQMPYSLSLLSSPSVPRSQVSSADAPIKLSWQAISSVGVRDVQLFALLAIIDELGRSLGPLAAGSRQSRQALDPGPTSRVWLRCKPEWRSRAVEWDRRRARAFNLFHLRSPGSAQAKTKLGIKARD